MGRGPTRKNLSAKETKQNQDDKQRLTEHFIQTLPLLLDKYRADPEKLANLLAIPQYFDLDIYTKSRQEQNLSALLDKIHGIVEKMHDTEVLDTAAKTLEHMCVEGHAIYTKLGSSDRHKSPRDRTDLTNSSASYPGATSLGRL